MSIIRSLDETKLRSLKFSQFKGGVPLVEKGLDTKLQEGLGYELQFNRRKDDLVRITKLLKTQPGLKFVQNVGVLTLQENISKFNSKDPFRSILRASAGTALSVATVVATILGQVPVSGTGIHLSADIIARTTYLKDNSKRLRFPDGNFVKNNSTDESSPDLTLSVESELGITNEGLSELDNRNPLSDSQSIDVRLSMAKSKSGKFEAQQDLRNAIDVLEVKSQFAESSDIIPFKFTIKNVTGTFYIYLRAYLESLNDNYTGEWNSTKYVGRAEDVYNYAGFKRSVDFNFKLAATSENELFPLYRKLNYLVGTTAPVYNNTYMTANYIEVTIGSYLDSVPGILNDIRCSWENTFPWELGLGKAGTKKSDNTYDLTRTDTQVLPHVLNIGMTFTPIHSFSPEFSESFIGNIGTTLAFDEMVETSPFLENNINNIRRRKVNSPGFGKFIPVNTPNLSVPPVRI